MKTIEDHIQKDKEILADPSTSEPMRHHIEDELHDLEQTIKSINTYSQEKSNQSNPNERQKSSESIDTTSKVEP